jgi:hypothetical protein
MLEVEGVLRTWRLLAEPAAGRAVPAEPLADHRLAYVDYEGSVSGGRGCVARWDYGTYVRELQPHGEHFRLHGTRDLLFAELATGNEVVSWVFGRIEQRAPNLANESSSESAEPGCTP